jgi:hypothetical protein
MIELSQITNSSGNCLWSSSKKGDLQYGVIDLHIEVKYFILDQAVSSSQRFVTATFAMRVQFNNIYSAVAGLRSAACAWRSRIAKAVLSAYLH